mgnify:FL=1|tara:strand:- start:149 stop:1099 length:951 start_codon:yes stop_codon:yes gene_type:complete
MSKLKNAGMGEHFAAEGKRFNSSFAQANAGFKSATGTGFSLGNKSSSRLNLANLPLGGIVGNTGRTPTQPQVISGDAAADSDWRVKLSLPPAATGFYRDSPIMAPLAATNGLTFPVTPTIILQKSANYIPQEVTHANYPYYAYNNSRVDAMSIIGNFPVQNAREGAYWVAALHFLRSVSKMFYGPGESQGNPPQILRLNGYGEHIFKDVPVIVEQVTIELRESVDYISVIHQGAGVETNAQTREATNKAGGGPAGMTVAEAKDSGAGEVSGGVVTRVPTDSVFTVLVQPVYSRKKIKEKFNLKDFANGTLAKDGFI